MADLVKALASTARAASDIVAAVLILLGVFLMIGAYVYRVFIQPEWTSEQAVAALWPFFLVGSAILILGWLIDRTATETGRVRRTKMGPRDIPNRRPDGGRLAVCSGPMRATVERDRQR